MCAHVLWQEGPPGPETSSCFPTWDLVYAREVLAPNRWRRGGGARSAPHLFPLTGPPASKHTQVSPSLVLAGEQCGGSKNQKLSFMDGQQLISSLLRVWQEMESLKGKKIQRDLIFITLGDSKHCLLSPKQCLKQISPGAHRYSI